MAEYKDRITLISQGKISITPPSSGGGGTTPGGTTIGKQVNPRTGATRGGGTTGGGGGRSTPVPPWQQPGAVVTERDAQGNVTKYTTGETDENGRPVERYTPDSTMYKLGFRDSTEYTGAANSAGMGVNPGEYIPEGTVVITNKEGKPLLRIRASELAVQPDSSIYKQWVRSGQYRVPIKTYDGGEALLTQVQADSYISDTPVGQYKKAKELGIIPKDARYVAKEAGWGFRIAESEKDETYESPEAVRNREKIEEFKRNNVQLETGEWVSKEAYQKAYDAVLADLETYKNEDGNYDIEAAIYDKKLTTDQLEMLFGQRAIQPAKDRVSIASDTMEQFGKDILEASSNLRTAVEKKDYLGIIAASVASYGLSSRAVNLRDFPVTQAMIARQITRSELDLQSNIKSNVPSVLQVPATAVAGFGVGVLYHYMAKPTLIFTALAAPFQKDPRAYIKETVQGVAQGYLSLPSKLLNNPSWEVPKTVGIVLGPAGTVKLAKWVGAQADAWHLPSTGMTFRFNTDRIGANFAGLKELEIRQAATNAVNSAMKSKDGYGRGQIGSTEWYVEVLPTPVNKAFGGALFRMTDFTDFGTKVHEVYRTGAEPAEFYSMRGVPRFALTNAYGAPNAKPAVIMLYTKSGLLKDVPFNYNNLSTLKAKGFEYLGSGKAAPGAYAPIKTFLGKFELEAELPNGMKVFRVPTLRSRLLGERSGDFVTTYAGNVIPVFRFAEKGAAVPDVSILRLAAIRVESAFFAMNKLLGKTRGFSIVRLEEAIKKEAGIVRVDSLSRPGFAAIDAAATSLILREYKTNSARLEEVYERDSDIFDEEYLARVTSNIAKTQGYRTEQDRTTSTVDVKIERPPRIPGPVVREARNSTTTTVSASPRATDSASTRTVPTTVVTPDRSDRKQDKDPPPTTNETPRYYTKDKPDDNREEEYQAPPGTIAWKQGMLKRPVYWVIPPPYRNRYHFGRPPRGFKDSRSLKPKETIQVIGGPVREPVDIIIGIMIIHINAGSRKIQFRRVDTSKSIYRTKNKTARKPEYLSIPMASELASL